jgi:hypothetical protein
MTIEKAVRFVEGGFCASRVEDREIFLNHRE